MTNPTHDRRNFLKMAAVASSGVTAAGLVVPVSHAAEKEKKVEANEDLMREHGILRRALLVYRAAAIRLRNNSDTTTANALMKTAKLFRTFGEDYHERKLEEKFIFPVVRKLKGPAATYPDVLVAQHNRGRELTDYVMRVTQGGTIAKSNVTALADALNAFELMYEHHTAREDTIVFTAWKDALSQKTYDEMSEQFEDIEKQTFGRDGFDEAVKDIASIEAQLGLTDISQFTIAQPPLK
jgi:hemerythrin-like domain-containing protein